jgi:hypothetical protein
VSDQICSAIEAAVESAIEKVVQDFQRDPNRVWNEREINWLLFHYLQLEKSCAQEYPAQLIRAEFPTLKVFKEGHQGRGHYDLVVLDSESCFNQTVEDTKTQYPMQSFLEAVRIKAAVEIKLWSTRCNASDMAKRINWNVKKLTEKPNNVQFAYFINLVQLPFKQPYLEFNHDLFEYLRNIKHDNLRILFAPADRRFDGDHEY